MVQKVILVTDGACIGNPGPGGWACILRYETRHKELFGSEEHTTNNRMEMRAVIEGMKTLRESSHIIVTTDSQYVRNGITKWIAQWKRQGWQKKTKGTSGTLEVLNRDLWEELDSLAARHEVDWKWVRGHAGHADNVRCDHLALLAARKQAMLLRAARRSPR
ncbi:MAG: ribonuclease HI [Acidobacteriota bacterium]|nr:ribonuclease HI [Acidobacteriota bacterium]